jgi:hypothetical protein
MIGEVLISSFVWIGKKQWTNLSSYFFISTIVFLIRRDEFSSNSDEDSS